MYPSSSAYLRSGSKDKPRYPSSQQHMEAQSGKFAGIPNTWRYTQFLKQNLGSPPTGTYPENLQVVVPRRQTDLMAKPVPLNTF